MDKAQELSGGNPTALAPAAQPALHRGICDAHKALSRCVRGRDAHPPQTTAARESEDVKTEQQQTQDWDSD